MKIVTLIARILLGLGFLLFGLNGFLNFIPQPPLPDGLMKQFSEAMVASHYMMAVSAVEVVAAVLLIAGRFVPLALTLLGPVIVNILFFHIFLAPATIGPGLVVTLLWFLVFFSVRQAFAGIFKQRA